MLIFYSKSGKVFAKINLNYTYSYDENLSYDENEKRFFQTERQALERYGFKPVTWAKDLAEYQGSAKELWEFYKKDKVLEMQDGNIYVTRQVYSYFIDNAEEIFSNLFLDDKYHRLAYLYGKLGDNETAKIYLNQASELYAEELKKLKELRERKRLTAIYYEYLKNCNRKNCLARLCDYMTDKDIASEYTARETLIASAKAMCDERTAKLFYGKTKWTTTVEKIKVLGVI